MERSRGCGRVVRGLALRSGTRIAPAASRHYPEVSPVCLLRDVLQHCARHRMRFSWRNTRLTTRAHSRSCPGATRRAPRATATVWRVHSRPDSSGSPIVSGSTINAARTARTRSRSETTSRAPLAPAAVTRWPIASGSARSSTRSRRTSATYSSPRRLMGSPMRSLPWTSGSRWPRSRRWPRVRFSACVPLRVPRRSAQRSTVSRRNAARGHVVVDRGK